MPDLDVQFQPSAELIRRREFATIRRGYDPEQVRGFLLAVADSIQSLEDELQRAKTVSVQSSGQAGPTEDAAAPAKPGPDPYEALGKRFAGLLGTADKEAQRLVTEAKAESTRILTQARTEADRIRVNAQARAEEARAESLALLEKAREESERALTGLSSRREALLEQLQTMQARLLSAADDLAAVIERPDEAISVPPARSDKGSGKAPKPSSVADANTKDDPSDASVTDDADIVDPRYEDLWVSTEEGSVDIPDLASIELDFDDERPSTDR
jgi:DivIVA domain-containing protein